MLVDALQIKDEIVCWVRDESGIQQITTDAPYYCYQESVDGEYTSIFNTKVSKKEFSNGSEYKSFIDSNQGLFESDITPIYKFISDNFYKAQHYPLNVFYFDIEVDFDLNDGKGYPTPENPFGGINALSLFDRTKKQYHCLIVSRDTSVNVKDDRFETFVYHCVSERQLLDTFFHLIEDADILTEWNGDIFDIPYIVERCKILYGTAKGLKKLCRGDFTVRTKQKQDRFNNTINQYVLVGRTNLDLLELYRKFTFGERTSFKLDVIAEQELKKNKIEYDGDLGELYRTNPSKFLEYSLHDVRLMVELDEKLKLIDLAITMANKASVKILDVFGSIKYLEMSIRNYCHFDRADPIVLQDASHKNREPFEGAFVLNTRPGKYGWVMSVDLASLYPSVIRTINISPETHIFQCKNTQDDFLEVAQETDKEITVFDVRNPSTEVTLTAKELKNLLIEQDLSISAYGSIFIKPKGIIPEVLDTWVKLRADTKAKAKEFLKQSKSASTESEKNRLKTLADYYDMQQTLYKVSNNSLYGAISNPHSRFYSIYLAASVTITGQYIERFQIYKADQIAKRLKSEANV